MGWIGIGFIDHSLTAHWRSLIRSWCVTTLRIGGMSFQAYLATIKAKTGKGPDDFRTLAAHKGFTDGPALKPGVKAGDIVQWLKDEFQLGHGHAMAIYALLKGAKSDDSD